MTIGKLPSDKAVSKIGEPGAGFGIVVNAARSGIKSKTGIVFDQPLSGQRAIRKDALDNVGSELAKGFGVEVALTLAFLKKGYRVLEVDTMFRHRVTGHDFKSTIHRAKQYMDVMAALRSY
jgi:hypothetical protein